MQAENFLDLRSWLDLSEEFSPINKYDGVDSEKQGINQMENRGMPASQTCNDPIVSAAFPLTRNLVSYYMCAQFQKHGAFIDRVYFSPYHPTAGIGEYRKDEDTRKPGPGMTLGAKRELGLSLENSVDVGDKQSDILAGITARVRTNILFASDAFAELAGLNYLMVRALKEVVPCLEGAVAALAQR